MSTKYLNTDNILKKVYDPSVESLRTTATATFVGGTVDISISDTTDSIKVGDGTGVYLDINPDGSINSNVEIDAADGDNIAINDGIDTLAINSDGSINITDNGSSLTVDAVNLDTRDLTHVSDSIKIGDGIELVSVNINNELNIRDDDANTNLISIDEKLFAPTAIITTIARSNVSQTVLASNANRKGCLLVNDTGANCFISYAATSTTSTYTFRLTSNAFYEMAFPIYTGIISVIWGSNGANNLNVTELT